VAYREVKLQNSDFLARLRHQHMQAKQHLPNQQLFLWVRAVHFLSHCVLQSPLQPVLLDFCS